MKPVFRLSAVPTGEDHEPPQLAALWTPCSTRNTTLPFPTLLTAESFHQAWQDNPMVGLCQHGPCCLLRPERTWNALPRLRSRHATFMKAVPTTARSFADDRPSCPSGPTKRLSPSEGTEVSEKLRLKTPDALRTATEKLGWTLPEALDTFLATDILDDLNFMTTAYRRARVHKGFLEATLDLWPAIEADLVARCTPSNLPVFVTGHSLGGAMALIAGMTYPFERIVTFGAPRVGQDLHRPSRIPPGISVT